VRNRPGTGDSQFRISNIEYRICQQSRPRIEDRGPQYGRTFEHSNSRTLLRGNFECRIANGEFSPRPPELPNFRTAERLFRTDRGRGTGPGSAVRGRMSWSVCLVLLLALALPTSVCLGATLPPNTWVNMQAGGIAAGRGVGDEGYSSFVYAPGLQKGIVFGKYHARNLGSGEDQNALLAYDFAQNRWDLLEVTEAAWSESLPGVGHDQGMATIDPRSDLYITHGNMTLNGNNTPHQTYLFDLRAGRGQRMLPAGGPGIFDSLAMAFSPDAGLALLTRGPSWLYDPQANTWTAVPNSPPDRRAPTLVYDTKYKVFVLFGGVGFNETWTFDPARRTWTNRTPAVSPPARGAANMAYDSTHGVTLLVGGGGHQDMWVYETGANTWTPVPGTVPPYSSSGSSGNKLIYDSAHQVFLLKHEAHLSNVWAFQYVPTPGGVPPPPKQPAPPPNVQLLAPPAPPSPAPPPPSPAPRGEISIPPGVFVALDPPNVGQGIGGGGGNKHTTWQHNPLDGRLYSMGGDFSGPVGPQSYRQEQYSLSLAERWANRADRNAGWRQEYPYCGPDGGVQPKSPDYVGWTWDTKRQLFWMVPGSSVAPGSTVCPDRTASNTDDPKYLFDHLMTFNPAAAVLTQRWTDRGTALGPNSSDTWMSTYDPQTDTLIRFGFAGCCGAVADVYNIPTATWSSKPLGSNALRQDVRIWKEMQAVDYTARVIYAIDGYAGRLHRYAMDTRTLQDLGPVPGGRIAGGATSNDAYAVWDSVNRVLLFFRIDTNTLHVYHPETAIWESPPIVTDPPGLSPSSRHGMVFDPYQNVLALLGTTDTANLHLWLYRYANRK